MRIGQHLATPLGDPIDNLTVTRTDDNPNLIHLEWDTGLLSEAFFQVLVNGYRQKTTTKRSTDVYVAVDNRSTQNFIEIIAVGALNYDEDCYHLLNNADGNKAILKWKDRGDTKEYLVYGDSGGGTIDESTVLKTVTDIDSNNWYNYKSGPLTAGTYKYAVRGRGFDGAYGPLSAEIPIDITTLPLCVSGLTFKMLPEDHIVWISWEEPPDASFDNGKVYWNAGSGEIDWEHCIGTALTGMTWNLPNDFGNYKFGVRSWSESNSLESLDWDKVISFNLTAGWSIQPTLPLAPYGFEATGVSQNFFKLSWRYNRREEDFLNATKITHFNIHGSGLTGVDWSYLVKAVTAGVTGAYGFCEQYWINDQPWPGGSTYQFGVKASTIDGFEGPGVETILYMHNTLPSLITGLTIATSQ